MIIHAFNPDETMLLSNAKQCCRREKQLSCRVEVFHERAHDITYTVEVNLHSVDSIFIALQHRKASVLINMSFEEQQQRHCVCAKRRKLVGNRHLPLLVLLLLSARTTTQRVAQGEQRRTMLLLLGKKFLLFSYFEKGVNER